jgi:hypothetical protein
MSFLRQACISIMLLSIVGDNSASSNRYESMRRKCSTFFLKGTGCYDDGALNSWPWPGIGLRWVKIWWTKCCEASFHIRAVNVAKEYQRNNCFYLPQTEPCRHFPVPCHSIIMAIWMPLFAPTPIKKKVCKDCVDWQRTLYI